MRPDSLLRSTPFRLALAFALVFLCAFLLSGLVAFDLIKKELNVRYDSRTEELFQIISKTYEDSDIQDVVDATRIHIAATSQRRNVFLLQAPDGRVLAGNIPVLSLPDGWSLKPGTAFGIKGNHKYRLFAGNVGPYRLIVGTNNEETGELEEIVGASFGWASLVIIVLAISGGALIAFRAQRRLDAVRDTMARVSHGDLASRIPLRGRGDDLDLLASDINDALERLAASVESMRQVSSDIAHDLKTPLNHLKITLEDARLSQERGEAVLEQLEVASNEVDQINQTFDALLRIAQIESGARKARFGRVRLDEILESLTEVYSDVAEDAGDRIVRDFNPAGDAAVYGDRELLTQMYANLIENAIRHCPSGAAIRLKVAVDGSRICTSIEDSGPGIPEEERSKVFQRLYRLEKSRTSAGTGLGLSLVKAIADLHDADIRLEDASPGLRVVITFARA
jgi:signal transduction histidine kinase